MFGCGLRFTRVIVVVSALVLPMATACGDSDEGREGGSAVESARRPLRTAQPVPTGRPQKQTVNIERGTTGYVGGLRLGVMAAANGRGIVAVLAGPEVPEKADWTVSGRAGFSKRLANGYRVTLDKVFDAEGESDQVGSDGASVTVTVTPPN
ncbi:hypothetical protein [Actinomadura sp. HBU206391]|uniref:hypothetical protein n=1 Tax=Actinomadura sp. HBU206391 TaxID=2731692 RepID=UPI00164F589E|nr:hypothetical protein [Actinomadura sp. HBU206391]MBC6459529.1 hypothetical protein [Actinomadura sp. HBU206391]